MIASAFSRAREDLVQLLLLLLGDAFLDFGGGGHLRISFFDSIGGRQRTGAARVGRWWRSVIVRACSAAEHGLADGGQDSAQVSMGTWPGAELLLPTAQVSAEP